MGRPPTKQLQILEALQGAEARGERAPALADLARRFGIRYPTLRGHLDALARKGYLRIVGRGPGRSPDVTLLSGQRGVPLYGEIAAGLPIGEAAEPEGFLALRLPPDRFALRVRGDSMADRIEAGDVVVLERGAPERRGEICAVRIGDDESTLKYVDWVGARSAPSAYLLRPHNRSYPTLRVAAGALQIDGVMRGLLRGEAARVLLREGGDREGA